MHPLPDVGGPDREDGFTVVELAVVVAITGLILSIIIGVLVQSQNQVARQISRTQTANEARLAIQSITMEVRSGNVVYDPSVETYTPADVVGGYSFRVYTQTNAPTRLGPRCVQYRIRADGNLERRDWAVNWQSNPGALVSGWRVVASGVRNRDDAVPAFTRPQTNNLVVLLRVNEDPTERKGRTTEVRGRVSGRNTLFFSTQQPCGPPTPDPSLTGTGGSKVPPY